MIYVDENFSEWLITRKEFGGKTARDVLSRINRINGFMDADASGTVEKILYTMSVVPAFKTLSLSVRSQLRRSVKLYKEYQRSSLYGQPNERATLVRDEPRKIKEHPV
jgi:DNA (cytosine-5)-methyltransferase 1